MSLLACAVMIWTLASAPADSRAEVKSDMTLGQSSEPTVPHAKVWQNGDNGATQPPQWVLAPAEAFATSEPTAELDPCQTPDPGFGTYEAWEPLTKGQLLCPHDPAKDSDGNLRVVFHFHGHEAARKEWVQVTQQVVFVALDLGNSSSTYSQAFADPSHIESLLRSTQEVLTKRLGRPIAIGRFGLSAWSAGYAAVRQILSSEYQTRVDAVLLLDGLHASTLETGSGRSELAPFVEFAQRAARDERLMFVSHSSITPPDYASTTQSTSYLIWSLGGNPQAVVDAPAFPAGLQAYRRFDQGGFHALGFRGASKSDHCAQVALFRYAAQQYLLPRWGL